MKRKKRKKKIEKNKFCEKRDMYKSYDLVLGEFKKMCGSEEAYKQDHHFNRFLPSSTSSNLSFTPECCTLLVK